MEKRIKLKKVIARKEHVCVECLDVIKKDTEYWAKGYWNDLCLSCGNRLLGNIENSI